MLNPKDGFISKAVTYDETAGGEASLTGFLEEVSLVADIDGLDEAEDRVLLMTLHSAKGLEFPIVYMVGMEDGLFPGYMSVNSDDPMDMEEERRLCYVGITRAEKKLILTGARARMINGETVNNPVSRFLKEIPEEFLEQKSPVRRPIDNMPKNTVFREAKKAFKSNPYAVYEKKRNLQSIGPAGANLSEQGISGVLNYEVGDRVRHIKFGEGEVTGISDMGRDFEVTVNFDRVGTKKMFAGFAKLTRL